MSKWDSFSGKAYQQAKVSGTGLFSSNNDTYQTIASSNRISDAALKVSKEIQRNFDMCNRLPKQPSFKTDKGEITVEDGVLGAIGDAAAQLLDLSQANQLGISFGLGTSTLPSESQPSDDD